MSRGGSSWRTGSPDRLNALLENQTWDPVLMFGGRRPPTAAPAPPPAAPPPPPPPAPPSASGFVAPEWCAQPRGARTNAHLLVWRGAALVETIPVGGHAYLIAGRLPECGIVLEHGSASRQHAALLNHRSGATYVMDLGSAHGTFLSGRRLPPREPTLWEEGAACVFGASSRSYVLRLSAAGPLAPPPSAGVGSSSSSSVQPAQPPSLPVYHPTPAVAAGVSTGAGVAAHAAAWHEFLRGRHPWAFVIEDDAVLEIANVTGADTPSALAGLAASAEKPGFDFIFVGGCPGEKVNQRSKAYKPAQTAKLKTTLPDGQTEWRTSSWTRWLRRAPHRRATRCTSAYIVSRQGAAKVLRYIAKTGWRGVLDLDMNVMAPPLVAYHTWPTMAFQACHHVHLDGVDVRLGTEGRHCTQKLHPEFAGDRKRDCYC